MMPIDEWVEIEQEIHQMAGLNAAVYDVHGQRITNYKGFANRLCPTLRATGKGQQFICAVAHQNMASRAAKTGKTVVAECDAGLMKFVVPIIVENEFLGTAGGCGLLRDQEQVDAYLVHRTTGLNEEEVRHLAENIKIISSDTLQRVLAYTETKVAQEVQRFNGAELSAVGG